MLDPGTKLGPYEIVAPLGAGEMGEVYRTRDSFEMHPPNQAMPLFDVTPDGEKFVVVTSDQPESSSITLVIPWTPLLKKQ